MNSSTVQYSDTNSGGRTAISPDDESFKELEGRQGSARTRTSGLYTSRLTIKGTSNQTHASMVRETASMFSRAHQEHPMIQALASSGETRCDAMIHTHARTHSSVWCVECTDNLEPMRMGADGVTFPLACIDQNTERSC